MVVYCLRSLSVFFFLFLFCFQAEDGIRDLVRSRGLGDVYKRQTLGFGAVPALADSASEPVQERAIQARADAAVSDAVSYTHLTLPTSDLV